MTPPESGQHTTRPTRFLLYGLQRSGTNFLEKLVRENFPNAVFVNDPDRRSPGHKHFRFPAGRSLLPHPAYSHDYRIDSLDALETHLAAGESPDYFLVLVKDPYSWYVSYLNWSRRMRWPKVDHHYVSEWNQFYNFWQASAETHPEKVLVVRYEDLLRDGKRQIRHLATRFDLVAPQRSVTTLAQVPESRAFTAKRLVYYNTGGYFDSLTPDELDGVNDAMDQQLCRSLGYELTVRHPWANLSQGARTHRSLKLAIDRAVATVHCSVRWHLGSKRID